MRDTFIIFIDESKKFLENIATILIPIIIFFLGVIFQKRHIRYKRNAELKLIKDSFLFLSEALPERYIKPQMEQLQSFYADLNIDISITNIPPITISGDLKRLSGFSSSDLFSAFRILSKDSDSEKNLHCILSQVDYLIEQKEIIYKYHDSISIRKNELTTDIQKLIEDYLDLISNIICKLKKNDENYEENNFWLYINSSLMDYYNSPQYNNTITFFRKNLLLPMQKEIIEKGFDRKIEEAERIAMLGKKLMIQISYLRFHTFYIKCQYRQFYEETSMLLVSYQEDLSKITKTKQS